MKFYTIFQNSLYDIFPLSRCNKNQLARGGNKILPVRTYSTSGSACNQKTSFYLLLIRTFVQYSVEGRRERKISWLKVCSCSVHLVGSNRVLQDEEIGCICVECILFDECQCWRGRVCHQFSEWKPRCLKVVWCWGSPGQDKGCVCGIFDPPS